MWQATRAEAPASKPTCYCHCATCHLQPYSPLSSRDTCTAAGERGAAVARLGQALCHTRLRPAADWVHEAATALRSTGAEAEAPGAVPELRTPSASNLCTRHSNKPGRLGLKHSLSRRWRRRVWWAAMAISSIPAYHKLPNTCNSGQLCCKQVHALTMPQNMCLTCGQCHCAPPPSALDAQPRSPAHQHHSNSAMGTPTHDPEPAGTKTDQ